MRKPALLGILYAKTGFGLRFEAKAQKKRPFSLGKSLTSAYF